MNDRTAVLSCLLLGMLLCRPQLAQAQPPLKKTLPNGLTVLVKENHAAPVVAVRIYVKTGSIYEGQYLGAGLSHLFEHTLSEGTKTRTKEQMNDEVAAIGNDSNAYTTRDVTAYHIATASSYFERAVAVLADQMQNAVFPEAEVKTQLGVIHNEMNLDQDDPEREVSELFYNTAFLVHPVRYPVIGYPEVFDRLTRQEVLDYYNSHYTPENTVISIAGDVKAARAWEVVSDAFKQWQRRSAARPALPSEPRQTSPRRAVVEKAVGNAYLMMGWHTVPLQHPDLYALDVLAQLFGGGPSSRLVERLRDRQNLVAAVAAFSDTPNYDAGMFCVRATVPPAGVAAAESAVLTEVRHIRDEGVTQPEIRRAARQIQTSFIFANADVEDQAEQMALDEIATGDPGYSQRYVYRIQQVTPRQVQEVAQKYLRSDGLTTAVIAPASAVVPGAQQIATAKQPQLITLANGLRLVLRENHAAPTVSIVVMGLGGVRSEPANQPGISNLASALLTRGTTRRSSAQIAQLVGGLGGALSAFSGYNAWGVQSTWLAGDWRRGLALLHEVIRYPTFPDQALKSVRTEVVSAIKAAQDDPESAASLLLRQTFYSGHPYGRPPLGTPDSVRSIKSSELKKYWARVVAPASTVVTIYGDINPDQVRRAAEWIFQDFPAVRAAAPASGAPPALTNFTLKEQVLPGAAQVSLFYGYPGVSLRDADRYAVDVMDAALSGAGLPGGRLHTRLRDNKLVYVVHAYNQPGINTGMFVIYADTSRANQGETQRLIHEEVQRLRELNVTDQELASAKSMCIAAKVTAGQTNLEQAMQAASNELTGPGYDDQAQYERGINSVAAEDVRRVAFTYLREEAAALAAVGP